MVRFEIYPKLPLFMGKLSFFYIYGKLYGKLFSVPVNCSLRPFLVGEQSSKYKVGCFIDFVLCTLSRLVPCGATKYKKCVFTDLSRPRILWCNVSTYKLQKCWMNFHRVVTFISI